MDRIPLETFPTLQNIWLSTLHIQISLVNLFEEASRGSVSCSFAHSSLRLLWLGSQGTPGGIRNSVTLYVLWLITSVVDNNQYSFWLKSKNCVPLINVDWAQLHPQGWKCNNAAVLALLSWSLLLSELMQCFPAHLWGWKLLSLRYCLGNIYCENLTNSWAQKVYDGSRSYWASNWKRDLLRVK